MKKYKFKFLFILTAILLSCWTFSVAQNIAIPPISGELNVTSLGAATYTIPIECPDGIGGIQPNLSLVYNSQLENGTLGLAWNLEGLSAIYREGKNTFQDASIEGITFTHNDNYTLDGNRLVLVEGEQGKSGSKYRTELETYQQIEAIGNIMELSNATGPQYFRITTKEGVIIEYGYTDNSRIIPDKSLSSSKAPFIWMINKVEDKNGNYISYEYNSSYNDAILSRIIYGNTHSNAVYEIIFNSSKFVYKKAYINGRSAYQDGFYTSIEIKSNGLLLHKYSFDYYKFPNREQYRLDKVTQSMSNGSELLPTKFYWSPISISFVGRTVSSMDNMQPAPRLLVNNDMNGDGKDDIVNIYEENGKYYYKCFLSLNTYPDISFEERPAMEIGVNMHPYIFTHNNPCMLSGDFNGDGIKEFVATQYIKIKDYNPNLTIKSYNINDAYSGTTALPYSDRHPPFACGDLNNDGYDDLIYIENKKVNGVYKGQILYYTTPKSPSFLTSYRASLDFDLPGEPHLIYISDFDSDGLKDLCIITASNCRIYKNQGGKKEGTEPVYASFSMIDPSSIGSATFGKWNVIECGDFNGDGILDFLVNKYYKSNTWYVYFGTGKCGFIEMHIPQITSQCAYNSIYDRQISDCIIADYDDDGQSEIIIVDAKFETQFLNYEGTKFQWLKYNKLTEEFEEINSLIVNDNSYFHHAYDCVGDFNGDGKQDIFTYRHNISTRQERYSTVVSAFDYGDQGRISNIDNGLNGRIIMYKYLSRGTAPFYEKTAFPLDSSYLHLQLPLCCTTSSALYSYMDMGSILDERVYSYKDLTYGLNTRKLYGFGSMTNTSQLTGMSTTVTTKWDYTNGLPRSITQEIKQGKNQPFYTSKKNNIIKKSAQKNYIVLQKNEIITNNLEGITTKIDYLQYDDAGNIKWMRRRQPDIIEEQYMEYINANSWCDNKLSKITTKRIKGGENYSRSTSYVYNAKGNLTKEIQDPGSNYELTTYYSGFNAFGLPQKTTISGSGISYDLLTSYTSSGRFVTSQTNRLGETVSYYWNENTGLLLSETTAIGTTYYHYDNYHRLSEMIAPDKVKTSYRIYKAKGVEVARAAYSKMEHTEGRSPQTIWYDCFNRELRKEWYGYNNKKIWIDTEYDDSLNLVKRVTKPYFSTDSPAYAESYLYDVYGRPITIITPLGTTIYSYNKRTTEITSPTETRITKLDSEGNPIEQTVNGKKVVYTYYPSGLLKTATPEGGESVIMKYNLQGKRTELQDPDGGTIYSYYNAFGELTTEQQWIHKSPPSIVNNTPKAYPAPIGMTETNYVYSPTGLLKKATTNNGESTLYIYDSRNRLINVQFLSDYGTKGVLRNITYGDYNRIIRTTDHINGSEKTLTTQKDYDLYGNLSTIIYPDNFKIRYHYDDYGNLSYIVQLQNNSSKMLWYVEAMNALGQYTQTKRGNLTTNYRYDSRGFPTQIQCGRIIDMTFSYNPKGQLVYRQDNLTNQSERFAYDNQNRLTNWATGIGNSINRFFSMEYDSSTGNIINKSEIGEAFQYNRENSAGPHALTSYIGKTYPEQSITYTEFKKLKNITQEDKSLSIFYGPSQERAKEIYEKSNGNTLTRYFSENYEEENETGNYHATRKIHYIYGGDGLAAVHIHKTYDSNVRIYTESDNLYYTFTDNQGSLIALATETGEIAEKYAYDPWGCRRNPTNWRVLDTRTSYMLDRGYCMHQHLGDFNLINMNGRMYDPYLAMFLSPDPYVQAPDNWLNYNRYSYCLNNPLMYTDPSGEFWHLAIAGFIGGISNWLSHGKKFNLKGLGYFGIGALSAAISAGVGSGITASISGSTFGGGFIGSSSAMKAISTNYVNSFITGASIAGSGVSVGGFLAGFGNSLLGGKSFGNSITTGLKIGIASGASAAVLGGLTGGVLAQKEGRRFWDGATVENTVLADRGLSFVLQNGDYNCAAAVGESVSRGVLTQNDIRNELGGDPNTTGLIDIRVMNLLEEKLGRKYNSLKKIEYNKSFFINALKTRNDVIINMKLNSGSIGHMVALNKIVQQTITKPSGKIINKYLFYVMDPSKGQYIKKNSSIFLLKNVMNRFVLNP